MDKEHRRTLYWMVFIGAFMVGCIFVGNQLIIELFAV